MISFHWDQKNIGDGSCYADSFYPVDTDDVNRIAKAMSSYAVSLIQFKDGYDKHGKFHKFYRHSSCFVCANWIGLDFEDGPKLSDILESFFDIIHVCGVSRNHQRQKGDKPPSDRFHIFMQLPEMITDPREYRSIVTYYINEYDADAACKDAARFFWPCREIVSVNGAVDDTACYPYFLDIKKPEADYRFEEFIKNEKIQHNHGILSRWTRFALRNVIPQGERHSVFLKVANELARAGLPFEDAVDRIVTSPTFKKAYDQDVLNVENVIRDAYKYVYSKSI